MAKEESDPTKRPKIKKVMILLVGTDPLFMDRMSPKTLEGLRTGNREQVDKSKSPIDICKTKIYRNDDGQIILPIDIIRSAVVGAGQGVKVGKKQMSTAERTDVHSHIRFQKDNPLLLAAHDIDPNSYDFDLKSYQEPKWVVDERRGVGKQVNTPTAVCITRPMFPEWACWVGFTYEALDKSTVRKLWQEAGENRGFGSFRPSKGKGPFGRFFIRSWMEETVDAPFQDFTYVSDGVEQEWGSDEPAPVEKPRGRGRGKNRIAETLVAVGTGPNGDETDSEESEEGSEGGEE